MGEVACNMGNWKYLITRVGQALFVLWAVVTITFILYRLMPFGPVEQLRLQYLEDARQSGGGLTEADIRRINRRVQVYTNIDPDQPVYIAYLEYMKQMIFHLDFGQSIRRNAPVFKLLFERMPWSIFLSVFGLALGTSLSLLLGALMAHFEGSRFDKFLTVVTVFNSSVPYYIVAIITILVFGFGLGWLPTAGKYNSARTPGANIPFMISIVKYAALPVLSLFIANFGGALGFRANCIREKGKEYIRAGRLRGIREPRLAIRYMGRNALLPIYTNIMLGISALFSSSVIVESIFNYQAVGLLTFQALQNRDYPLLMGALIFLTTMTLIGILIADLTYGIIDPRVEGGADRETY
jgi:peptide/nickel transport system permease protein